MIGDGRGAGDRPHGSQTSALSVTTGAAGVAVGLLVVLGVLRPLPASNLGPFSLDAANPTISLSFPDCAVVVVHWTVVAGPRMNFSVGTGEALLASNCNGPPPSNATCVQPYCGGFSMAPGPICFEQGLGGTCSFTATQPMYGFAAVAYPYSIGNATVLITIAIVQAPP